MQLGKSMYTGKNIDLNELLFANTYDIDHIIPQSKLKDDSFDNIVLVEKTINKDKDNRDYLDESIRLRMNKFWNFLREKGFITIEKYNRLRRNTYFSDDELSGFISRQLVTTRQSTLEVKKLFELYFLKIELHRSIRYRFRLLLELLYVSKECLKLNASLNIFFGLKNLLLLIIFER